MSTLKPHSSPSHRLACSSAAGFTLIEVMVVVAILAILASVAYPAYTSYIQRGYRANAKTTLLEAAQFMERYRSANFRYVDAGGNPPALPARLQVSPADGTPRYTVAITAATANSFSLAATPTGWTDADCGTLTLDNLGQKGASGPQSASTCWNR
ncbi:MAG: type IV pilin protein [Hylemonella sp.]